jgi:hypothetical protein
MYFMVEKSESSPAKTNSLWHSEYQSALDLLHAKSDGWTETPPAFLTRLYR